MSTQAIAIGWYFRYLRVHFAANYHFLTIPIFSLAPPKSLWTHNWIGQLVILEGVAFRNCFQLMVTETRNDWLTWDGTFFLLQRQSRSVMVASKSSGTPFTFYSTIPTGRLPSPRFPRGPWWMLELQPSHYFKDRRDEKEQLYKIVDSWCLLGLIRQIPPATAHLIITVLK